MSIARKGAIAMTNVLTNAEDMVNNYEIEHLEKNTKITKIEIALSVYKLKHIIKSEYAQKIMKENIVKDKAIKEGRYTIKGTRVTPDDIGKIIMERKTSFEDIMKEYPSLDKEEQILAGLLFYISKNLTWRKVFFTK